MNCQRLKETILKLFDTGERPIATKALESMLLTHQSEPDTFEEDTQVLHLHTQAYNSLSIVHEQVVQESFSFIDKGNYVLYNEYIKSVTQGLGFKQAPVISQEAINTLPTVALNHHLALEGLIGTMWEKIKALFSKIYESIKKFFAGFFTRLGRLKKKLENLLSVLKQTNSDLKTVNLDKVPGDLASKFPVNGHISINVVNETFKNISVVGNILTEVNTKAKALASKDILDKSFVAKVKSLKDLSRVSKDQIKTNEDSKTKGLKSLYGKGKQNNKDLDTENKSLKKLAKDTDTEINKEEGNVKEVVNDPSNANLEFDEKGFVAAKKEFNELLKSVEASFGKLVGKTLVGGKTITKVEVKEDSGINIESEENKETPNEVVLASSSELIKLLSDTLKLIENTEKLSNNYGEINDTIMKNNDTVDKLIKDIDAIDVQNLGKYKTILTTKVRERLTLMKTFFNNYNKINKNLFTLVVECAEGNVSYAVTSLKYFG